MISRRMFIQGALGCALGGISIGSYGRLFEPRWVEINKVDIYINNLPKRFQMMTIAQLSDIHHCKYVPREFVRKCVRKVNALSPDIIALTGDYVYNSESFLPTVAEELRKGAGVTIPGIHSESFLPTVAEELAELRAKEGVFAVLGNHDKKYITLDILSRKGIQVLINKHILLYRKKEYLFIAGVDDLWRGKLDIKATLKGTDHKPKILLCHNPDAIETIKHTDIDFVMAGHTHGGQVSIPLYGPPVVYSKFGTRYASGLFYEGNTTMYVNKGIGTSDLPVRFFARPEITLFTLQNSLQSV